MPYALLEERATLHLTGPETEDFLQNLLTADIGAVSEAAVTPAALLTPQGKVMFAFLVSRIADGFRLDMARAMRADLKKRLTLYRLRRKIAIEESEEPVVALWRAAEEAPGLADRRFPDQPVFRLYDGAPDGAEKVSAEVFRALRIRSGVAEIGEDYGASEVFPHDVLMDFDGGVSFRKGCFVGQEVVSRMQHRGTARRRLMLVTGEAPLVANSEIRAGDRAIGEILSIEDDRGLAMVRIDRLAAAAAKDAALSVEGVPVALDIPPYAGYVIPEAPAETDTAGDAA